jgi:phosphoribosylformimino-5-aminoimidazole carboxamide ribotide isomerase
VVVIPAIDLKDGRCVRLKQGVMRQETVFSQVPEEMAERWYGEGAERLHVVDLNGAVEGRPVNRKVVESITRRVPIPVQLGGGIRDLTSLEAYFDLGVHDIILGTAAHKDPDFLGKACQAFPGRIILGIDARKNRVAVEGWTEEVDVSPVELVRRYETAGISAVIYTDIHRDGMRSGPNVEATRALARAIRLPVIASGGISGIDDILNILALSDDGVAGMITGRALYEGSLKLGEAMKAAKGKKET